MNRQRYREREREKERSVISICQKLFSQRKGKKVRVWIGFYSSLARFFSCRLLVLESLKFSLCVKRKQVIVGPVSGLKESEFISILLLRDP